MASRATGSKQQKFGLGKALLIGFFDALAIFVCFFFALWMRFDFSVGAIPVRYLQQYITVVPVWCAVSIAVLAVFSLYNSVWSFVSTSELFRIIAAYSVLITMGWVTMPRSFYVGGFVLSFVSTVCIRFAYRILRTVKHYVSYISRGKDNTEKENVMIIGAGESGRALVNEFATRS